MAKYLGTLTSDARGKVGGIILSRSRAGTTIKGHAVPVNPSTPRQQLIRTSLAAAGRAWRALDGSTQAGWVLLADTYTWTNSLGTNYTPTGQQLFTQAYINAAQYGTVPGVPDLGAPPVLDPITNIEVFGDGTFLIFLASDPLGGYTKPWLLYASRPLQSALTYTKTIARRLVGINAGTNEIIATAAYTAAFGLLPPAYSYITFRAVGVDPTLYISATPYVASAQVIP